MTTIGSNLALPALMAVFFLLARVLDRHSLDAALHGPAPERSPFLEDRLLASLEQADPAGLADVRPRPPTWWSSISLPGSLGSWPAIRK